MLIAIGVAGFVLLIVGFLFWLNEEPLTTILIKPLGNASSTFCMASALDSAIEGYPGISLKQIRKSLALWKTLEVAPGIQVRFNCQDPEAFVKNMAYVGSFLEKVNA